MAEEKISGRVLEARKKHKAGYNCVQSVCCTFCDLVDMDEETMFRVSEGLGLGMGGMDGTCGAISAAAILAGLKNSTGNLESPNSKAVSYRDAKACLSAFKEKNGTITCRDLKGVDTKTVIRSCPGCVDDAVQIIEEHLFKDAIER